MNGKLQGCGLPTSLPSPLLPTLTRALLSASPGRPELPLCSSVSSPSIPSRFRCSHPPLRAIRARRNATGLLFHSMYSGRPQHQSNGGGGGGIIPRQTSWIHRAPSIKTCVCVFSVVVRFLVPVPPDLNRLLVGMCCRATVDRRRVCDPQSRTAQHLSQTDSD